MTETLTYNSTPADQPEFTKDEQDSLQVAEKLGAEEAKQYAGKFNNAEDLENENEIIRLRKNLDQQLTNLQNLVTKLANKLQRQLLAKQNRSWDFDLEEGMLDSSKLSRISK